jgi:hypothetical protein
MPICLVRDNAAGLPYLAQILPLAELPMPAMLPLPHARPLLASLALAALLGGCAASEDQFAPACPGLALLPDAADVTRFDGHGMDVTNLIVRASMTAVPAVCAKGDKDGTVKATLHVNADFTRGPAAAAGLPPVAYFVALMQGRTVLREQDFAFSPTFGANVDFASVHGDDIELVVPVGKAKSAAAYRIYVGFRLSPEELAYNRTHPRP